MGLSPEAVGAFLKSTRVFADCPDAVLAQVTKIAQQRQFAVGDSVLSAGHTIKDVGFVVTGRVSMSMQDVMSGNLNQVGEIGEGDAFGVIGLMLGGVSPVTVTCVDNAQTLHITKAHFEQLVDKVAPIARGVAKLVSSQYVKSLMLGVQAAASSAPPPAPASRPPGLASMAPSSAVLRLSIPAEGGMRYVDVTQYTIGRDLLDLVPSQVILDHRLLPLELQGQKLIVGMCTPESLAAQRDLRRILHGVDPEIVAISQEGFAQTIQRLNLEPGAAPSGAGGRQGRLTFLAENKKHDEIAQVVIGDQVIDMLDKILLEAIERGASSVHLQPEATGVHVRFRVKGRLVTRKEPVPATFAKPLVARCKVLAELDIAERRLAQDGRMVAQIGKKEINFRVSTLPTDRGEKVAIRVLDPADVTRQLGDIFLDPRTVKLVDDAVAAPSGAVLIAGASGSGKTATAYSLLSHRRIARPNDNVCTVEDPVEYLFPGIAQVSVNSRIGLGYPELIRAMSRQDPDVLVVGDLRNQATTTLTMEAALTGQLVVATLHGSSVAAVLQRLEHLGINRVILSQALSLVVVQRLVPRLCELCTKPEALGAALFDSLIAAGLAEKGSSPSLARPVGCDTCNRTGYNGRVAVVDVLRVNTELKGELGSDKPIARVLESAQASGLYVPFASSARMLMARQLLAPGDALLSVAAG